MRARSRAGQGFPERIEDPAAVAVLAALLRDARPPPRNQTGRRTDQASGLTDWSPPLLLAA